MARARMQPSRRGAQVPDNWVDRRERQPLRSDFRELKPVGSALYIGVPRWVNLASGACAGALVGVALVGPIGALTGAAAGAVVGDLLRSF